MSLTTPVPSDLEADTLLDLVHDCREVAGVLGVAVVDLLDQIPQARRSPTEVLISARTARSVDGLGDY